MVLHWLDSVWKKIIQKDTLMIWC